MEKRYRDLSEARKSMKTPRTVNFPAEIKKRHIPNTTQKPYLFN
jgi:hypothetical protein